MMTTGIIALGVFVGLVLGLTGAGGSIIAVPLLMALLGWTLPQAAPVALMAVATASLIGTVAAWRGGLVRYRAATLMAGVGVLVTPLGSLAAHRLPLRLLAHLFAVVLIVVAFRMLAQAWSRPAETRIVVARLAGDAGEAVCRVNPETGRIRWNSHCAAVLAATGALTGFLSGLLGVGGGFIIVPALRQATQLTMQGAVATSLMVMTLVSLSATASMLFHGATLPAAVAAPFVAGTVLGMVAGRGLAPRIAGPWLQRGFALLLLCIAAGMTSSGFGGS